MRAGECVFHEQCFICVVCGIRLCTGDQYVIKHSQLFCRPDYEKEVNMMRDEINRNTGRYKNKIIHNCLEIINISITIQNIYVPIIYVMCILQF